MSAATCSRTGCINVPRTKRSGICENHYRKDLRAGIKRGRRSPDAGYSAVHSRLERDLGKASSHVCVDCAEPAAEWGWIDRCDAEYRVEERGGSLLAFTPDQGAYRPLCRVHHRRRDRERRGIVQAVTA